MDDLDPVTDPHAAAMDGHDDIEPVPEDQADRVGAMGRAHELALEDEALALGRHKSSGSAVPAQ